MKKLTLALTAALCLTALCLSGILGTTQAQNRPAAASTPLPVKIGLVDMARVFKEYDKFKDLRDVLKGKMEARMAEAQKIAEEAKIINEELKLLDRGGAKFIAREARLAELTTRFQTKQKLAQAEYIREEAKIFEQIYKESRDVIHLYAKHYEYTLVIRFNSTPLDPDSPSDPQGIANVLNKLVVYHQKRDDITGPVLDYLNKNYTPARPTPPPIVKKPGTGTRTN